MPGRGRSFARHQRWSSNFPGLPSGSFRTEVQDLSYADLGRMPGLGTISLKYTMTIKGFGLIFVESFGNWELTNMYRPAEDCGILGQEGT